MSDQVVSNHYNFEPGESTPLAFDPLLNPTDENPQWSQILDLLCQRIVSTALVTNTGAEATSLPPTAVELTPTHVDVILRTPGSMIGHSTGHTSRPANRDAPNITLNTPRTSELSDCSVCSLGDLEKPTGPTHGSPHQQDSPNKDRTPSRLSNRQSLIDTALLAHQGNPPDEDIMPKRVADSERPSFTLHQTSNPNVLVTTNAPPPLLSANTIELKANALSEVTTHPSPPLRSRPDHTEGNNPQPTDYEGPVEEPVRPSTQHKIKALTTRRLIVEEVCTTSYNVYKKLKSAMNIYITHNQ